MAYLRSRLLISATMLCVFISFQAIPAKHTWAQDQIEATSAQPNLTEEEMRQFLLKAKIIKAKHTKTGVTRPWQLTLSDGTLTHDAAYQSVDEFESYAKFADGSTEINFRDSYQFNIAAYELSKLLGLQHMMPVTVERKYKGKKGSFSWWIDHEMNEKERIEKNIRVPDTNAWAKQMHRLRVFYQLVYDKDRNATNVLIDKNWKIYMIDFSRAFRLHKDLPKPEDLVLCSRPLLEKLRQLDPDEVKRVLKPYLDKGQIEALMARRDKIVSHFDELIKQKGENAVLY
jgi:hypothetical protein